MVTIALALLMGFNVLGVFAGSLPTFVGAIIALAIGGVVLMRQSKNGWGLKSLAGLGLTLAGVGYLFTGITGLVGFSFPIAAMSLVGLGGLLAVVDWVQ